MIIKLIINEWYLIKFIYIIWVAKEIIYKSEDFDDGDDEDNQT